MLDLAADHPIRLLCPAKCATGGTELLHQLAVELRDIGFRQVRMHYTNASPGDDPIAARFRHYAVPHDPSASVSAETVLIIPEILTEFWHRHKCARRVIWWMSVDNYFSHVVNFRSRSRAPSTLPHRCKQILAAWWRGKHGLNFRSKAVWWRTYHLAQSAYAWDFLQRQGVRRVALLSDYLGQDFLQGAADVSFHATGRRDVVLFNPEKGWDAIERLRYAARGTIEFIAAEKLSPQSIVALMRTTKVYVDFGNHPGKDRIPREAALLGNIVITGRKGAAAFFDDLPIPDRFKIDESRPDWVERAVRVIQESFTHYDEWIEEFAHYRQTIQGERADFKRQTRNVFRLHG